MKSDRQCVVIAEIERLALREVFPREDLDFTPWLCEPENLGRLSRSLGIDLEFVESEVRSATYRSDILARNVADGSRVIIENQFHRSDHDHLGKLLTYLAAHGARTVIWIAEAFTDEHRAALEWLNEHTPEEVGFFAVSPEAIRIADSPSALNFKVVVAPNAFVKRIKSGDRKIDEAIAPLRERFWARFEEALRDDPVLSVCQRRYGGRLGFQWLIPPHLTQVGPEPPHVLVYVVAPAAGPHGVGFAISERNGGTGEWADLCDEVWKRTADRLRESSPTGTLGDRGEELPADFSSGEAVRKAVDDVLPRIRAAYEELCRALEEQRSSLAVIGDMDVGR